ncbi:uncharacterized protein LAJ45_02594 [Morchella importuna]|uniref:uncharacterized protein n=1 Tax=Morchella importuna TaxID=1174673 RepID=UPI001E8E9845|nr:uncharacterized protein LAJ45_02594 [Morchella importuna]KAH8153007.1 hypothetical protein LAJ45_02594 [Morchella importuna]
MLYQTIKQGVALAPRIRVHPGFLHFVNKTQMKNFSSEVGAGGEQSSEMTGSNVMGERVAKLEGKCSSLHGETVRLDGWNKYVIAFGVGTVLLGIGGAFFKILDYDAKQNGEMKAYVKTTVETSEKVLQSKLDVMESKLLAEIRLMQNRRGWW